MNDAEIARRARNNRFSAWASMVASAFLGGVVGAVEPLIATGALPADGGAWKRVATGAVLAGGVAVWQRFQPKPGAVTFTGDELRAHLAEAVAASQHPPPLPPASPGA